MKKLIVLLIALSLVSCSTNPFAKKKDESTGTTGGETKKEQTQKATQIAEEAPKPGDIKVLDGVEYIYARNKRWQFTPYEPEYMWIRKDQYSPGFGENLLTRGKSKEQKELETRLAKIEEEMKKKGLPLKWLILPRWHICLQEWATCLQYP
jgi:hypothetical protein